uniref:Uncharacterized protein n=1 Tax=viral metagenome TaxID=1070528 RepID=A0A6C0E6T9_9ZZZZ
MTSTTLAIKNLEDVLFTLNENNKSAADQANSLLMTSIYKVATESQVASKSFDDSLYEIFNDIESCVIEHTPVFNPSFVVEMKDGKGYSIIENWDTSKGLLPDRKVVGYYVITIYYADIHPTSKQYYQDSQRCGFEIDNYMNMYHPTNKFYIMINKTSFPLFPFYMFRKHFVNDSNPSYQKQLLPSCTANHDDYLNLKFNMTENVNYSKKDNRDTILANVHSLVHPQYKNLLEFVEKFRNFSEYKFDITDTNGANQKEREEKLEQKREIYSAQSKIIRGLETKLEETLTKYKASTQFIETITNKLNTSLTELVQKNREIDVKNAQILKLEHKLIETSKTLETEKNQTINELNIEHEKNVLILKRQLVDADCFKTQCSSLEITIDDVKNDLSNAKLQIQKEKDSNKGLLQSIINTKEELSKVKADNEELLKTISEYTKLNRNMENENNDKNNIIEKLKVENKFLSDQVSQKYNEKNDELFKALNQRIKELEKEYKDLSKSYKTVNDSKNRSDTELANIKQLLSKIK